MKESTEVQEFLNSNFEAEQLGKFDSYANLWFIAYGVASLIFAILPTDNIALNVNLGFANFVVSGVLNLAYEVAKHYERIDLRIALFRWLRWYTLMLISALVAVFGWFIVYAGFLQYLNLPGFAGQIIIFFAFSAAIFLLFQFPVKWLGHRFLESIRRMLKEDNKLIIEVATGFTPTGLLSQINLFLVNSFIFLAILEGNPFYTSMMPGIVSQPFAWIAVVVMLPIVLPFVYKNTISEQANMIRQIKIKASNSNGDG